MNLNTTEEILEDLSQGKMVIIMDDEDRENEGDLIILADKTTAEAINFMARYGRGLICLTLTQSRCQQLRLPLMVGQNDSQHSTNFTVSIEAAKGVTTGISASDRAKTVLAAVAKDAKPEDIVQPGHIFPLMAKPGGVLVRAGHTEAGCDLARLARSRASAAVIVEILNEDGTMARRPDLEIFAKNHDLKIGTIDDLIEYRVQNEKTIERINECNFPSKQGNFRLVAYQDTVYNEIHLALVKGKIAANIPTLVRVHMQNTLCDLLGSSDHKCGWPLTQVMQQIEQSGAGVIIILRNHDNDRDIVQAIQDRVWHDSEDDVPARAKDMGKELRTLGVGAQILADIGVGKMRVMSAPVNMHGLQGFGLEVIEFVDEQ